MKRFISAVMAVVITASLLFAFSASANVLGDFDGNEKVTSDDAVYLLRYTLFPETYPVSDFADFDHNEKITSDDAVYLLRYTLFPETYPLTGEEGISLKGETIVFLVENGGSGDPSAEIMPDEELFPDLAGSVRLRNDAVEQSLGVTIAELRTDDMYSELRLAALDVPAFDIAMPYLQDAAVLAPEGVFADLYGFGDIIDFYAPYWDQNANYRLSIGGRLYMTTGDISPLAMGAASCVFYNKKIVEDYNLQAPFDCVCNGWWTLDMMYEMALLGTCDTNGDGTITHEDTVGLYIGRDFANALYFGGGEMLVRKDENDLPVLALEAGGRQNDVVEKISYFFSNPSVILTESIDPGAISDGHADIYQIARESLVNDRALFVTGTVSDVQYYKEYRDTEIGIVPAPKIDTMQDSYHTCVDPTRATVCTIPATHPAPEKAAFALESVCAASTDTVRRGYYELVSDSLGSPADETEIMLEIIFESRVYDLGVICNWAGMRDFIPDVCTAEGGAQSFASRVAASEQAMQSAISDYIDSFADPLTGE